MLVESPGSCGSALIRQFAQLSGQSQAQVARCLYQAPGILMKGLPEAKAEKLSEVLNQAGARTRVVDESYKEDSGVGEWEIALAVDRVDGISEVLSSLVDLLQVQPEKAVELLCKSPAVVMGNLSEVAVTALRERFERAGAKVDASRPRQACYDLYMDPKDRSSLRRLEQQLATAGIDAQCLGESAQQASGLLALGLDWNTLQAYRSEWMRHIAGLKVLNRDYARYDLVLHEQGPQPSELVAYLHAKLGIPVNAGKRILEALPVVIGRSLNTAQQQEHVRALTELKARASSHLLSWQCFSLRLEILGDRQQAARILRLLAGMSETEVLRRLSGPVPLQFEGPFSDLQARWIRHELARQGTETKILKI
ncbi:MAG: hypothetical protein JJU20_13090 [Opitutales bacterium]|nr:hypothetical protein [Opitutales bacterium]